MAMGNTVQIGCKCGQTSLEVTGAPITSVECCCTSCREAADRMQRLEDAPQILTDHGTTHFVMYRKDRVRFLAGSDGLKSFRLSTEISVIPKSLFGKVAAPAKNGKKSTVGGSTKRRCLIW